MAFDFGCPSAQCARSTPKSWRIFDPHNAKAKVMPHGLPETTGQAPVEYGQTDRANPERPGPTNRPEQSM